MEDLRIEKLHVWGDNPFEAEFGIRDLLSSAEKAVGWKVTEGLNFEQGFIPVATIQGEGVLVKMEGFGNYRQWTHLPNRLDTILGDGKVDQVFLYPDSDTIDLAIEDSSATMTGNQVQQRMERIAGFAVKGLATAYLVPKFALKKADGGIRQPNIWPIMSMLQLIYYTKKPHLIFYFGTSATPDDKTTGEGADLLSRYRWARLLEHLGLDNDMPEIIKNQIRIMLNHISERHEELFDVFPEWNDSRLEEWTELYTQLALGNNVDIERLPLNWSGIPTEQFPDVNPENLVNINLPLADSIARDIIEKRACFPISGKGRGRPSPKPNTVGNLIKNFKLNKKSLSLLDRVYDRDEARMLLEQGETTPGMVSPTVMEKAVVFYTKWSDLRATLENNIDWGPGDLTISDSDEKSAILFIAGNVVTQFLRDPYAGQIASYPLAFGSWDPRQQTIVVLWCPWQSAMVAHNEKYDDLAIRTTKGTAAWLRFVNWTVFHDAVIKGVI